MDVKFLAACAATPAAQEITVTAQGMSYQPASFEVTAGQPVRLVFQNDDVVEHDFSIMAFPMSEMSSQQEDMPGHNMGDMATQPELHVAAPVGGQGVLEFAPSEAWHLYVLMHDRGPHGGRHARHPDGSGRVEWVPNGLRAPGGSFSADAD